MEELEDAGDAEDAEEAEGADVASLLARRKERHDEPLAANSKVSTLQLNTRRGKLVKHVTNEHEARGGEGRRGEARGGEERRGVE